MQYILLAADAEHEEEDVNTVTMPLYDDNLLDENLVEEYLTEEIETADDEIHMVFDPDPLNEVEIAPAEDVYSCNVCGIEFSSVQQHIDEYHSEQEVVLDVGDDGGGVVLKQEQDLDIQDGGGGMGNTDEDTEEEGLQLLKQETVAEVR